MILFTDRHSAFLVAGLCVRPSPPVVNLYSSNRNSFLFHSLPNSTDTRLFEMQEQVGSQNNLRPVLLPLYPASHSRHPFPGRTCCTLSNRPTTGRHATPDKTRTHDRAKRRGVTLA